jgi:hypothetical protein
VNGLGILEGAVFIVGMHLEFKLDKIVRADLGFAFSTGNGNGRFSGGSTLLFEEWSWDNLHLGDLKSFL